MPLRAANQLRENLRSLMAVRRIDQKSVAFALSRHPTWINKILKGTRPVNVTDLDALADLFGLTAHQLFQPGISALTERRRGTDRRSGTERRVGVAARAIDAVAQTLALVRHEPTTDPFEQSVLERLRAADPELRDIIVRMLQLPPEQKRKGVSKKAAAS